MQVEYVYAAQKATNGNHTYAEFFVNALSLREPCKWLAQNVNSLTVHVSKNRSAREQGNKAATI